MPTNVDLLTVDLMIGLIDHIMAMRDDAYLMAHPEWQEVIAETLALRAALEGRD